MTPPFVFFDLEGTLLDRAMKVFDDVAPCLEALERAAVSIGIITQGERAALQQTLVAFGLDGRFSPLVVAEELSCHPARPELYITSARHVGRHPQECVYVGDKRVTHVLAAAEAGMHGVWLHRPGTTALEELICITRLDELPGLLGL